MSEGASAPPLTLFVIATVQARGSSVGVGFTNVGACLSSCMCVAEFTALSQSDRPHVRARLVYEALV